MSIDVFAYRLFRLRRLAVVAVLIPLATVLLTVSPDAPLRPLLILMAVGLPLAHVTRYPWDWTETITLSLALSFALWLASLMSPELGLFSVIGRLALLGVLLVLLLLMFVVPVAMILGSGPPMRSGVVRATTRSTLAPDDLRPAVTIYPGRRDGRTTCGPADADGVFAVETKHAFAQVGCGRSTDEAEDRLFDADGFLHTHYSAIVQSTGPDHHEIISFADRDGPVFASRYDFEAVSGGTRVTLEETTDGLPLGQAAGFWLQDYMADHLTDEIDRAEGRSPRANRAFEQRTLLVDLANWMLRRNGDMEPPRSDVT